MLGNVEAWAIPIKLEPVEFIGVCPNCETKHFFESPYIQNVVCETCRKEFFVMFW
jgi:hypothetical protein